MDKLLIGLFSFGIFLGIVAEMLVWFPPFNPTVLLTVVSAAAFIVIVALSYWFLTQSKNVSKTRRATISAESVFIVSTVILLLIGIMAILLFGAKFGSLYRTVSFLGLSVAPILLVIDIVLMIYIISKTMANGS